MSFVSAALFSYITLTLKTLDQSDYKSIVSQRDGSHSGTESDYSLDNTAALRMGPVSKTREEWVDVPYCFSRLRTPSMASRIAGRDSRETGDPCHVLAK